MRCPGAIASERCEACGPRKVAGWERAVHRSSNFASSPDDAIELATVWPEIINHAGVWDPVKGVAWSFWAALSGTSGLGLRYPLKMLPLLLIQLTYKSIWLVAVALPLRWVGQSSNLTSVFLIGVAFDLIAIPWPYVFAQYVQKPGDRWR
jgi:hypothetical protein